jgi:hypothetical protein
MGVAPAVNKEQLVARGEAIYQQRLKSQLEPARRGQIVAIEVDSGDYFVGKSVAEAGRKARAKHPEKFFYFVKIGFPTVNIHQGLLCFRHGSVRTDQADRIAAPFMSTSAVLIFNIAILR